MYYWLGQKKETGIQISTRANQLQLINLAASIFLQSTKIGMDLDGSDQEIKKRVQRKKKIVQSSKKYNVLE